MSMRELKHAAFMLEKFAEDLNEDAQKLSASLELMLQNVDQAQEHLDTIRRVLEQEETPFEREEDL